jgi:hypothetical protein
MIFAMLGWTLLLLVVCAFAPGFFIVRRFRWSPLEKLCGAIGLSLILLYLISWAVYCFAPASQTAIFRGVAAVSLLLGILALRDIVRLFHPFRARRAALGYAFLLFWTLLVLAMIRNYSGALWYGDWLEHFQRTLFFLQHFPVHDRIFMDYALPARPPIMNVLAAFFLALTADRFEIFQLVFAFLNLLMFLPCCLLMAAFARRHRPSLLPLVGIFAMSPVVMENVTLTWTKAFAAFFVVLTLWFYLAGWRKNDPLRMTAAFIALSAGLLVHFSAGPYVAFLALHYLAVVFRSRVGKWRELAVIATACGLLSLTWFGWSLAVYGAQATFASNTSVTSSLEYQGDSVEKIAGNLADSVLPAMLHPSLMQSLDDQRNLAGTIRDRAFITYQPNLIFGMGVVGGPLVLWLLWGLWRLPARRPEERFWRLLVPFCVVVGIAVVGARDQGGVAHLTLLAVEMLGLTLLAAAFSRRRLVACAIIAGCVVDFSLGVFLQAHVESLENTPQKQIFPAPTFTNGQFQVAPGPDSLSKSALGNWFRKHQYAVAQQSLHDLDRDRREDPAFRKMVPAARAQFLQDLREDTDLFHGWYARHGGEVTFLGDHFAEPSVAGVNAPACLLLVLALGLIGAMGKQAAHIAPIKTLPIRPARAPERKNLRARRR